MRERPAPRASNTGGWSTSVARWSSNGRRAAGPRAALARRSRSRCRVRACSAPRCAWGSSCARYLPGALKAKVPAPAPAAGDWPAARHARRMLVLAGCVQPVLAPSVNAAAARVLDRVGVSLIEAQGAGCCGAVRFHLNDQKGGRNDMRALIDAWWPVARARRGRGDRDDRERLRLDRQGVRPFSGRGPGLRRESGAHRRHDPRPVRGDRGRGRGARRAARRRRAARPGRVPVAVLAATRAADSRRGRGAARARRLRAHAGGRGAPVLRLGGDLFDPAADVVAAAARAQARARCNRACRRRSRPRTSAASRTCRREPRPRSGTGSSWSTRHCSVQFPHERAPDCGHARGRRQQR